jgi:Fic family protein
MLKSLAKIEVIKQTFDTKPISVHLLNSLRKTAKVSAVHYSTAIEGNQLSLKEVSGIVDGRKASSKQHDEKEVKAYYDAWNAMENAVRSQATFDEKLIASLHTLVEGSKKIIPYRNCQNAIYDSETGAKIYLPPEFQDVPALMNDLCNWVKNSQEIPVPIVAGIVHYQFVTIHPYLDGNGRTARLLTSFIMQSRGYGLKGVYSLEEYYAENLTAYYDALQTHPHHNYYYGRNEADITSWLEYFIEGAAQAFDKVNRQANEQALKGFSVDRNPLIRELDIKQRKVLELFVDFKEVDSKQISDVLKVSAQSARELIRKWVSAGFLHTTDKSKKARKYSLSSKYEEIENLQ